MECDMHRLQLLIMANCFLKYIAMLLYNANQFFHSCHALLLLFILHTYSGCIHASCLLSWLNLRRIFLDLPPLGIPHSISHLFYLSMPEGEKLHHYCLQMEWINIHFRYQRKRKLWLVKNNNNNGLENVSLCYCWEIHIIMYCGPWQCNPVGCVIIQ